MKTRIRKKLEFDARLGKKDFCYSTNARSINPEIISLMQARLAKMIIPLWQVGRRYQKYIMCVSRKLAGIARSREKQ